MPAHAYPGLGKCPERCASMDLTKNAFPLAQPTGPSRIAALLRRSGHLPGALLRRFALLRGLRESLAAASGLRAEVVRLQRRLALLSGPHSILRETVSEVLDAVEHPVPLPAGLRFSVILPVRDRPELLLEAIRSVLAQRWQEFELIIIDDGSAVPVAPLVRRHFDDPRIILLRQCCRGVSAARNRGLRAASGDLVAYLDSDNLWLPGFLQGMARGFARRPQMQTAYGVLISAEHEPESELYWEMFDRQRLEAANFIDLNVFVHRRGLVDRLGGFDESMDRLVDWDLILRYTAEAPAIRLPAWGAVYRVLDDRRISDTAPLAPNLAHVRTKLDRRLPQPSCDAG